jgi:hypothetical protein
MENWNFKEFAGFARGLEEGDLIDNFSRAAIRRELPTSSIASSLFLAKPIARISALTRASISGATV